MIYNVLMDNLMNNKDVYIRFDKFKSGEINKLLICASLSGSGKSTLGKKMAEDYNAYLVETDKFRGNVYYSDKEMKENWPITYEYLTTVYPGDRHQINNLDPDIRRKEAKKYLLWILERPETIVIEGGLLDRVLFEDEYIRNTYPIIFKGTSMLSSMKRMSLRELRREHPQRTAVDNIVWWMKWCTKYMAMKNQLNDLRDKIMSNDPEYEQVDEFEE